MPLYAVSKGIFAEKTIKRQLSTEGVLLQHEDYASLARVARKAMKKTLRLKKPVYVSPGLLHSLDWTKEFRERGWAAPGIRFGSFKPDLIKFERVQRKDDVEGEDEVSWEIVEVKYAGRTRDVVSRSPSPRLDLQCNVLFSHVLLESIQIYTNYKVQAIYCSLSP